MTTYHEMMPERVFQEELAKEAEEPAMADHPVKRSINELTERLHLIRDCEEAELRKFCENPTQLDFARLLTDRYWRCLLHLCNYDHAVDSNGVKHEITDVIQNVQDLMAKEYEAATGREYVPTVCRHFKNLEALREDQPTPSQQPKED